MTALLSFMRNTAGWFAIPYHTTMNNERKKSKMQRQRNRYMVTHAYLRQSSKPFPHARVCAERVVCARGPQQVQRLNNNNLMHVNGLKHNTTHDIR